MSPGMDLRTESEHEGGEGMKECVSCGFNDEDYGCACPSSDMWYACPIENKKPENIKALKEYAEWASKAESEDKEVKE